MQKLQRNYLTAHSLQTIHKHNKKNKFNVQFEKKWQKKNVAVEKGVVV